MKSASGSEEEWEIDSENGLKQEEKAFYLTPDGIAKYSYLGC